MRWSRKYEIEVGPIGDGYVLALREVITEIGTHRLRVVTYRAGVMLTVTRLILDASGGVVFGPIEEDRADDYGGDWLPPLYSIEDFVATLLITSPYF
jgi:hypothetical protein